MASFIDALKNFVKRSSSPRNHCGRPGQQLNFEGLEQRLVMTTAVNSGAWFNTSTWSDGVPDENTPAIVGYGVTVELDGADHAAETLVIHGDLVVPEDAEDPTKSLTTRWVHVNSDGQFIVGSEADRYDQGTFTLTLTGTDVYHDPVIATNMNGMHSGGVLPTMTLTDNDGFLMTAGGGSVQFYGEERLSFTKLAATVDAGFDEIVVENVIERNYDKGAMNGEEFITSPTDDGSLDWEIGDQIVIASSSYDYHEEDVRTITDINTNGDGTTTLTLDATLAYGHYGEIETYSDATEDTAATRTYEIDMRAEVALLSRNIKIQGDVLQDTDAEFGDRANAIIEERVRSKGLSPNEAVTPTQVANGVGGHLMFMPNSGQITVDGIQLEGLGQSSQKGRYPIHWHLGGDRTGDVLRNSSITNSNNRGVTIHGTSNLQIEGVILHDIHGHGFFFEDAVETGNELVANLALGIHAVGGNDKDFSNPGGNDPFVVDTHDSVLETGSRFSSSAAYWITNPDNIFVGNIAAGAGDQRTDDWAGDPGPAGTGFWFAIPRAALGDAMNSDITPIFEEFGQFDNNTSHSTAVGLNFDRGNDLEDAAKPGQDLDSVQPTNEYSPRANGDKEGDRLSYVIEGFTSYKASEAAFYHRGEANSIKLNDLRVADSKNGPWAVSENEYTNSLFVGNSMGNAELDRLVGGPRLYDGAGLYIGSHFAGFAADNAFAFQVEGSSFGPTMYHAFRETSFQNDGSQANLAHAVSDFTRGPNGEFRESHDLGRPAQWIKAALDLDGTLTNGLGGEAGDGAGFSIISNVDFLVDDGDALLPGGGARLTDDIYARIRVQNLNDGQERFSGDFKDNLNETLLRFTNQDGKVIEAIEGQNNGDLSWIQIAAKADEEESVDGTFTIEYGREGLPENGFVLNVKNQDGDRPQLNPDIQARIDTARIVIKIVGAVNYTPNNANEVFSDTDLRSTSSGVTYYRDATTGDLYLNTGISDSQDFIELTPGDSLQSIFPSRPAESQTIQYGTVIQAERFDNGIEGIAYHDSDATNSLGSFRSNTGVDVTPMAVGDIADGEWLEYTAEIVGNAYNVGVNVSSTAAGGKVRILAGISDSSGFLRDFGTIDVTDTQGQFQTLWLEKDVDLTYLDGATDAIIRLEFVGGGFEVDSFEFAAATQTKHSDAADRTIEAGFQTTTIELELYDVGGQGAAYYDDTPEILDTQNNDEDFDIAGNDSTKNDEVPFRSDEDVDANDNALTGKVFEGEWLEYTTDIQPGVYDVSLEKIWGGQGNGVKLYVANSNSITEFALPGEVSDTKFTLMGDLLAQSGDDNETITISDIDLSPWAGSDRVIRVEIVGNWMGLDHLQFESKTQVATGDFNADGDVDGSDFLSWQRGFGSTYDANDLTDWQANYGQQAAFAAASSASSNLAAVALASEDPLEAGVPSVEAVVDSALMLWLAKENEVEEEPLQDDLSHGIASPSNSEIAGAASNPVAVEANNDFFASEAENEAETTELRWLSDELLESVFG